MHPPYLLIASLLIPLSIRVLRVISFKICDTADAAFALHKDGCSTSDFSHSVGADNALFHTEAKALLDVATCLMTAEYYSAGASCQVLIHFRQLSDDLGWPCELPFSFIC